VKNLNLALDREKQFPFKFYRLIHNSAARCLCVLQAGEELEPGLGQGKAVPIQVFPVNS
jgi:hypothetical protein